LVLVFIFSAYLLGLVLGKIDALFYDGSLMGENRGLKINTKKIENKKIEKR
jgi:hypothetical protein